MIAREPYTEPYTLRERLGIAWSLKRHDLWRFRETGLWQWLAGKLPRRLVLFAFVRVMSHAWVETGKTPDAITYEEAYKAWEKATPHG
jgi:hypothetical protein